MKRLLLLFLLALALMLSACTAESPEKPAATSDANKFAAQSSQTTAGGTESSAAESSQTESSQPAESSQTESSRPQESSQTESSTSQESSKPEESSKPAESSMQEESSEEPLEEESSDPYVEPGTDEPILDASNYQEADWYINATFSQQEAMDLAMMFYTEYHVSRKGIYYDLLEPSTKEDIEWVMDHLDLLNLDFYTNAVLYAYDMLEHWPYSSDALGSSMLNGGSFTEDEVDYARANIDVDWYENAGSAAGYWIEAKDLISPPDVKAILTCDDWNGKFTEDQANYALEYYSDVFNDNCLNMAVYYVDTWSVSESFVREALQGGGFYESQIDYALTYCGADWDMEAIDAANDYLSDFPDCDYSDLHANLTLAHGFTDDQAAQACAAVGK